MQGLDTDNGTEFINYGLFNFCEARQITFTRSRAYRKNDQAHVEEKNGFIVRRFLGYERYEGLEAFKALTAAYKSLRYYVNFFQPSLKLIFKERQGAHVFKKYDKAKTPYQRLMISDSVSDEAKAKLQAEYTQLDPMQLLQEIEDVRSKFWKLACCDRGKNKNAKILKMNAPAKQQLNLKVAVVEGEQEKPAIFIPLTLSTKSPRVYKPKRHYGKLLAARTRKTRVDPLMNV